jgi:hypothetical protein
MTAALSAGSRPALQRPQGPFLVLDREPFLRDLNHRACFVHHRLTGHPLFELPRLLELARFLPPQYVRINSGAVPVHATPAEIPGTGLSLEESFARIGDSDTRIMLKAIEREPEYRDLLHTCLAEIEALGHPATRGITSREGYVFLSAPSMTTPYHMDPEINFLLQVRGRKTFHILSGDDRDILAEQDIELYYAGLHDHLPFKEEMRGRAVPFEMAPGDGVHVPVNHPHWVTTDNEVTISFALTLQTTQTHRRGTVYAVNHLMRRAGLKPAPFGHSPARDSLKYQGYRLWRCVRSCFPRKKRPEGH